MTPPAPLIYATRRSPLALAQARALIARLSAIHPSLQTQELQIVTSGDRIQDRPLAEIGGKGLFVKEIEEALLDRRAHFAVHSIKDVPAQLPEGLLIACIPPREDPHDVLVAPVHRTLEALPPGASVGTSSLRRMASLHAIRPDLNVMAIRGNVDTRLRKLDEGQFDAIVLARAGLLRLGLAGRVTEVLPASTSLPAVGQGALGVECRADDSATRGTLAPLHDPETATCVAAERGVLAALGGDCRTPLGAHAVRADDTIRVRAFIAAADGSSIRRSERQVPWPATEAESQEIGFALGRELGYG
jgi:hydroxymethylbilane synthase